MVKISVVAVLMLACSSGESVDEYNRKQAEKIDSNKPKGKAVKVETALPGGAKIACETLLDVESLTERLGEKHPVTLTDESQLEASATSVCSVRRGGQIMDAKRQAELTKKTGKLGVLAGDELCNVTAFCSIPADEERFIESCKRDIEKGGTKSNEALGVFACIKVTPKGPTDAYTYRFIDPDTRCVLRVRGGPSVNEESEVQVCAKAVLEIVGPEALSHAAR